MLKERMLDRMSDVSRLVERLRKADLLERKSCEADRRAVDVKITPKGLQLLKAIEAEITELDDVLKNVLDGREIAQLNSLLDKVLEQY
jgi:DNA-binding MarR family transcriptional regulator